MDNFNQYQYQDLLIRKIDPYADTKYDIILSRLAGRKLKILNIGCGSGELSYLLAEAGHNVVGIDPSQEYIDLALKNLPENLAKKCIFKVSSLEAMPQDNFFDCIIATDVLEHVKDDAAAMKKIGELLHPRGQIVITVPAGAWLFGYHDEQLGHFRRYSMGSLKRLADSANFNIESVRFFGFTLLPVCYLYSKVMRKPYPIAAASSDKHYLKMVILRILLAIDRLIPLPFGTSLILFAVKV